jgi:hypothetical protein
MGARFGSHRDPPLGKTHVAVSADNLISAFNILSNNKRAFGCPITRCCHGIDLKNPFTMSKRGQIPQITNPKVRETDVFIARKERCGRTTIGGA